jgi:hypothetical protein
MEPIPVLPVPEDLRIESGEIRLVPDPPEEEGTAPETMPPPPTFPGLLAVPDPASEPPSSAVQSQSRTLSRTTVAVVTASVTAVLVGGVALALWAGKAGSKPEVRTIVAAPVGALSIDVQPADAVVQVDDVLVPGTSPFFVGSLEPGTYNVAVSKGREYMSFEREIEVGQSSIIVPVRLHRREVELRLQVDPPGAQVELLRDGKVTNTSGDSAPLYVRREKDVRYAVRVSANGYLAETVPVEFTGSAHQDIEAALIPDPAAIPEPELPADGENAGQPG